MTPTARLIKVRRDEPRHRLAVYELSEPLKGHRTVVASGVLSPYAHEVMIFASTRDGDVTDWVELAVTPNTTSHEYALHRAGYRIDANDLPEGAES